MLATYKDLCIDVKGAGVAGAFWAATLGWGLEMHDDCDAHLRDADGRSQVWLNRVPEPKTVKNRIHLDVTTTDLDELVSAGASVLRPQDDEIGRTVLADPDGNEFCAFVTAAR